jgi:lysophospholipase
MGSWDPTLFGMAPLKYVGSKFQQGKIADNQCVTGFDNAAFVMGTSSSLFNAAIGALFDTQMTGILSSVSNVLKDLAEDLHKSDNDIANWSPNPFFGWNSPLYKDAKSDILGLVDGGEDYQNIPFYPHIQPARKVDVVFAVDSSADSGNMDGWPNGTSLVATYERHVESGIANGTAFPAIPDLHTITNLGLNARPTFFGCDAKNLSGPSPLIVYIPNHPYTYYTNISTEVTAIKRKERDQIIRNGYHVATMGNGTLEEEWPACVACAVLSRSFDRTGTTPPTQCQECFKKHCWNGTLDTRKPTKFTPTLAMAEYADSNSTSKKAGNKDKKDDKDDKNKKRSSGSRLDLQTSSLLVLFMIAASVTLL